MKIRVKLSDLVEDIVSQIRLDAPKMRKTMLKEKYGFDACMVGKIEEALKNGAWRVVIRS